MHDVWMGTAGLALAVLAGCTPTFNWRLVRPEGSGVAALLPCKPDSAVRQVPLAGRESSLSMLSCEVADVKFALAALQLPSGLAPAEAAVAWQQASAVSLQAQPSATSSWAPSVPRLPQGVEVKGWQVSGKRHDGRPVQAMALQVLRPAEVVQLVVYGAASPEVLQALWEGVQVDAAP